MVRSRSEKPDFNPGVFMTMKCRQVYTWSQRKEFFQFLKIDLFGGMVGLELREKRKNNEIITKKKKKTSPMKQLECLVSYQTNRSSRAANTGIQL